MYVYALRLMGLMGMTPKKGEGEEAFAIRASRESHDIDSKELRAFTKTALSARFGNNAPTAEETALMREYVSVLSTKMYATKPKWKKFIIKYVMFFD